MNSSILVIEDDASIQDLITEFLSDYNEVKKSKV